MANPRADPTGKPAASGATSDSAPWVPVDACALPTLEQPLRAGEFDDLFALSLRGTVRLDAQRARLMLTGDHAILDRVQRLVDAETSCCSFFTFTVTPLDAPSSTESGQTAVELTISVPSARVEVLEALVARAEQAAQVAP